MKVRISRLGGRIKSAAVGLDLFTETDPIALDRCLRGLRQKPTSALLRAFFPSDSARIKQLLEGIGLFRPMLKTDQGMGGNFGRFETGLASTPGSVRVIAEELLAFPEPHADNSATFTQNLQHLFFEGDLQGTVDELKAGGARRAEKGRLPFFFVRPAQLDTIPVVGQTELTRLELACSTLLEEIQERAEREERAARGDTSPVNLLWAQPDVYRNTDGHLVIEKINCPDVGLFLGRLEHPESTLLGPVQTLMRAMRHEIVDAIDRGVDGKELVLLTRDEVVVSAEDLLEQGELAELQDELEARGRRVRIASLRDVEALPSGAAVVLLNLNYDVAGISSLLHRHGNGSLRCYPNPYFQRACQTATGLTHQLIQPGKKHTSLLDLARSLPKDENAHKRVLADLAQRLQALGINTPLIHVALGNEVVPVWTNSLYSWRQLPKRAARYEGPQTLDIRAVPQTPANTPLQSDTGGRLHVYRFLLTT